MRGGSLLMDIIWRNNKMKVVGQYKLAEDIAKFKVREGYMLKRSRHLKEWKKRWMVLTSNYIASFTSNNCKEATEVMEIRSIKSYKSYVSKCEEMIPAGIKIRTGSTAMYLCASSVEEKWSWIASLERLVDLKEVGPSDYNNIESIREKGFPSQNQFENPGAKISIAMQKAQLNYAEKQKQNLELQAALLAKEIHIEKEELQREKQKVNQIKHIRMSLAPRESTGPEQQIDFLQQVDRMSIANVGLTPKDIILENMLDLLKPESDDYFSFKYTIEYLVNILAHEKLGYQAIFSRMIKIHPSRFNFAKIFMEVLLEYEPPTLSGEGATQAYSIAQLVKEMELFENWLKTITFFLHAFERVDFTEKQLEQISNKLKGFLLAIEADNTDELTLLLVCLLKINELHKLKKAEVGKRLQKIAKNSTKGQNSRLAQELLEKL